MSTPNLFGVPGAETLHDAPNSVYESNEDYWGDAWADDPTKVFEIEEWTAKPLRHFIKSANTIDHVIEWQCEEYLDEYGHVAEHLEARAKDPFVIAAFDDALDLLFAQATWRWAHELVTVHKVSYNVADSTNPLYDGKPMYGRQTRAVP